MHPYLLTEKRVLRIEKKGRMKGSPDALPFIYCNVHFSMRLL
jgi:hypothetical protein